MAPLGIGTEDRRAEQAQVQIQGGLGTDWELHQRGLPVPWELEAPPTWSEPDQAVPTGLFGY